MPLIRDICNDLKSVGQAHFGDLAHGGIGLFRRAGHHLDADTTPVRRLLQGRSLGLAAQFVSTLADELINRRHFERFPVALWETERGIYRRERGVATTICVKFTTRPSPGVRKILPSH